MLSCGHSASTSENTTGPQDCRLCDRRQLPSSVRIGRKTPTFTAASTPPALLADHRTAAWAELTVTAGTVEFIEPGTPWRDTARPDHNVTIVPNRLHHIVPDHAATFFVQFYDLPPSQELPDATAG